MTDNSAIETAHTVILADIQQHLGTAWDALQSLPEEQRTAAEQALTAIWESGSLMSNVVKGALEDLANAAALVAGAVEIAQQMQHQRDEIGDEYARLLQEIPAITDEAYATIIESLPNDISYALGISAGDAALLYQLLNDPEPESLAEDYGLTFEQLVGFREIVVAQLEKLMEGRAS